MPGEPPHGVPLPPPPPPPPSDLPPLLPTSLPLPAKRRKIVDGGLPELESRSYVAQRLLGKGSFGAVFQAAVVETGEIVAVKQMRLDADREVQIMKELRGHPNIVHLKGVYISDDPAGIFVNLVMEFVSDTLHRVIKHHNTQGKVLEHAFVKLYQYQLLRALNFIHVLSIIHTDVKPQNLLVEGGTHKVKLCDFGTARRLLLGEYCRPYVCSRYYRAPEAILGCLEPSTAFDLWSAGCVFSEMLLGSPLFTGTDGIQQLVEIINVLGTPSSQQVAAMNPQYHGYCDFGGVNMSPMAWDVVFRHLAGRDANEIADRLLRFDPSTREPPLLLMQHRFFDELRATDRPDRRFLFDLCEEELSWATPSQREKLVPRWVSAGAAGG